MSNIQWTDETWNPVAGCTRVSAGCDHCYAVPMTHRLGAMAKADRAAGRNPGKKAAYEGLTVLNNNGGRHFNGKVNCIESALTEPLSWRKPRRVFVNSMSDLFHESVPFEFIDRVFAVMALCPQHTFQVLTKRPERMAEYFGLFNGPDGCASEYMHDRFGDLVRDIWLDSGREEGDSLADLLSYPWPLPNVWLGTSVENQEAADERIAHLLRCPAAVRFLSCEPLLGPVDLGLDAWWHPDYDGTIPASSLPGAKQLAELIHWVNFGGESGSEARPTFISHLRLGVRQCDEAEVPCFVKQLGAKVVGVPCPKCVTVGEIETATGMAPCPRCYGLAETRLDDPKGGDPAEWPDELRVREWPSP